MSYFKKRVAKDKVFDELKLVNPMITIAIPDQLAERVSVCLKKKDPNTNKFYNIPIDNQIDSVIEIPFLDLWNYNKSILQMGSVILLEDSTGEDLAVNWLIDSLSLTSLYKVMASVLDSIDKNYSVKSIQRVIDTLVENKNNLTHKQLFVIRNMINFGIIQNAPVDVVGDLIIVISDIFENSSWSERTTTRLFR